MASIVEIPPYIAMLYKDLCDHIGGSFHSGNQHRFSQVSPKSRISSDAVQLKGWMSRSQQKGGSLDELFDHAIKGWIQAKNEQQTRNQRHIAELMAITEQHPRTDSKHLSMVNEEIERFIQPSLDGEAEEGFICVDDGLARQIAFLEGLKNQPKALFEAVPRIKAAFDYLKAEEGACLLNLGRTAVNV